MDGCYHPLLADVRSIFFFSAKHNLFGGHRTFLKVMTFILCILRVRTQDRVLDNNLQKVLAADQDAVGHEATGTASAPPQRDIYSSRSLKLIPTTLYILYIICIELTIRWSK